MSFDILISPLLVKSGEIIYSSSKGSHLILSGVPCDEDYVEDSALATSPWPPSWVWADSLLGSHGLLILTQCLLCVKHMKFEQK